MGLTNIPRVVRRLADFIGQLAMLAFSMLILFVLGEIAVEIYLYGGLLAQHELDCPAPTPFREAAEAAQAWNGAGNG